MSDSLWPHGLQHARLPCPSPTPGADSNSCPLRRWCHPTISFSVVLFSCLQFFPASWSFQMSQFFASGAQSTGVSASASVLPMNTQDWYPLGWTGWISLLSTFRGRTVRFYLMREFWDRFKTTQGKYFGGFLGGSRGKEPTCQCRRRRFNPWLGRPLQHSFLENPMEWIEEPRGCYSPRGYKESDATEAT